MSLRPIHVEWCVKGNGYYMSGGYTEEKAENRAEFVRTYKPDAVAYRTEREFDDFEWAQQIVEQLAKASTPEEIASIQAQAKELAESY